MHTLRTRFKKEIVAEFLAPNRKSQRVIIFCDGMPVMPCKKSLLEFFAKKGYWVFSPRYRGTWESGGKFLEHSPVQDIIDVVAQLPKGFKNLGDDKIYKLVPKTIYLFASSFGGAAGLLASSDTRITKVIALSPVVDWKTPSKTEPIDWLAEFIKSAFGKGYRFSMKDWNKLKNGKFYNPMAWAKKIDGKKILIIHAKNDKTVLPGPVQKFAKITGSQLLLLKKGGHFSSSSFIKPLFYQRIKKFFHDK